MAKRPRAGRVEESERADKTDCDPLSPKGLHEIIKTALIDDKYKIPHKSRLRKLSEILNTARFSSRILSELRGAKAATEQVQKTMDALDSALLRYFPAMKPLGTLFNEFNNDTSNESEVFLKIEADHWKGLVKMYALITAMREARELINPPGSALFRRAASYEDRFDTYSSNAADAFIEVVEAVNPGITIGRYSNNGPLPRFLSAIAPHVSGETITAFAVKARLRKVK